MWSITQVLSAKAQEDECELHAVDGNAMTSSVPPLSDQMKKILGGVSGNEEAKVICVTI
jgi:hypothetical protein